MQKSAYKEIVREGWILFALLAILVLVTEICAAQAAVPPTPTPGQPLSLTMRDAIRIALSPDGNARVLIAAEVRQAAEARKNLARAALLPQINGYTSYQGVTRNIAAAGVRVDQLPGGGLSPKVGPFSIFDARLTGSWNFLDMDSIYSFQAARERMAAEEAAEQSVRDDTAGQVALAYNAALLVDAKIAATKADLALAEELERQARNRRDSGVGVNLDVTRASVRSANQRQQLIALEAERSAAYRGLLRLLQLPIQTKLTLADPMREDMGEPMERARAVEVALSTRADLIAEQKRERSAEKNRDA
jgi:outer membrane protein TolC